MNKTAYVRRVVIFTLLGVLFAGYLSGTKLLTGTCAFNEPCPYFLGYPACWYGFALFLSMFAVSLSGRNHPERHDVVIKTNLWISLLGTIFAGYFVVGEIFRWMDNTNPAYGLKLPTCVYGLVFYIIIFVLSALAWRKKEVPVI